MTLAVSKVFVEILVQAQTLRPSVTATPSAPNPANAPQPAISRLSRYIHTNIQNGPTGLSGWILTEKNRTIITLLTKNKNIQKHKS